MKGHAEHRCNCYSNHFFTVQAEAGWSFILETIMCCLICQPITPDHCRNAAFIKFPSVQGFPCLAILLPQLHCFANVQVLKHISSFASHNRALLSLSLQPGLHSSWKSSCALLLTPEHCFLHHLSGLHCPSKSSCVLFQSVFPHSTCGTQHSCSRELTQHYHSATQSFVHDLNDWTSNLIFFFHSGHGDSNKSVSHDGYTVTEAAVLSDWCQQLRPTCLKRVYILSFTHAPQCRYETSFIYLSVSQKRIT